MLKRPQYRFDQGARVFLRGELPHHVNCDMDALNLPRALEAPPGY